MKITSTSAVRIAAFLGLTGVGLGAFGAHGLHDILDKNGRLEVWDTAVLYQFVHALAILTLSGLTGGFFRPAIVWCWTLGALIFSGSLYALALTNIGVLGAITPIGGVLFLTGWGMLLFTPHRPKADTDTDTPAG